MPLHVYDRIRPTLDGALLDRAIYIRGFSRVDFARQAGISEPTLRRALRSEPVNLRSAQRIAAVIGQTEPSPALAALIAGSVA